MMSLSGVLAKAAFASALSVGNSGQGSRPSADCGAMKVANAAVYCIICCIVRSCPARKGMIVSSPMVTVPNSRNSVAQLNSSAAVDLVSHANVLPMPARIS